MREPFISKTKKPDGEVVDSKFYYIRFVNADGKLKTESTRTTDKEEARLFLRRRLAEVEEGKLVSPRQGRVRVSTLLDDLITEYEINGRRSLRRLKGALKHIRAFFGHLRAVEVTPSLVDRYVSQRHTEGASNATINRELTAVRRAFNLAHQREEIPRVPHICTLKEDNVRTGFFEPHQYEAVLRYLPELLRPLVQFLYLTGWRVSEAQSLTWRQVDFKSGVVRLEPGTTKNRDGRTFPFAPFPELRDLLKAQWAYTERVQRDLGVIVPHVFHRQGHPIRYFRKVWQRAVRLAGCPGRIPHDFRRTVVRNLERAGVSRSAAMKLTGHKTESIYRRYAIVSEGDLHEAVHKLSVRNTVRTGTPPAVNPHGPVAQVDRAEVS